MQEADSILPNLLALIDQWSKQYPSTKELKEMKTVEAALRDAKGLLDTRLISVHRFDKLKDAISAGRKTITKRTFKVVSNQPNTF